MTKCLVGKLVDQLEIIKSMSSLESWPNERKISYFKRKEQSGQKEKPTFYDGVDTQYFKIIKK